MPVNRKTKFDPNAHASRVQQEYNRLKGTIAGVDDGDLILILDAMLRPLGSGRKYFIRKRSDGRYVF